MTPGQATEPGAKHDIQDTKNQTLLIYLLKLSVWCSGSREPKNERRIGKMRSLILGWT